MPTKSTKGQLGERIKRQTADQMAARIQELKRKERELADEKEKVEILKNPCTSLCNHGNEMRSDLRKQCTVFREKNVRGPESQAVTILSVDPAAAHREKRKIRGMWLVEVIPRIFHENREVYGCRKMIIALQAEGICVSEWKIRRIMRENGLYPQAKKKWKPYKKAKNEGLIFHSDRGSQYSSRAYKRMLQENGIEGSMSAPGCPYDNSCVESFFITENVCTVHWAI